MRVLKAIAQATRIWCIIAAVYFTIYGEWIGWYMGYIHVAAVIARLLHPESRELLSKELKNRVKEL